MADSIKEEEYLKARKLADNVGNDYLEKGVLALAQLPYFSKLMMEPELNPNLQYHNNSHKTP